MDGRGDTKTKMLKVECWTSDYDPVTDARHVAAMAVLSALLPLPVAVAVKCTTQQCLYFVVRVDDFGDLAVSGISADHYEEL